jgi:hypothetical protein
MSEPEPDSSTTPARQQTAEPRSGFLTALMLLVGLVLLLPGACAAIFGFLALTERSWPSDIIGLIILGLLIGAGGVALIVAAIRGRKRRAA